MASVNLSIEVPEHVEAQRKTQCPNNVLLAIYGKPEDKKKAYDHSLTRCGTDAFAVYLPFQPNILDAACEGRIPHKHWPVFIAYGQEILWHLFMTKPLSGVQKSC